MAPIKASKRIIESVQMEEKNLIKLRKKQLISKINENTSDIILEYTLLLCQNQKKGGFWLKSLAEIRKGFRRYI